MNTLFMNFTTNGTIESGSIRVDGEKVPDMTLWEVYDFYRLLLNIGYKPIITYHPDTGAPTHMIVY